MYGYTLKAHILHAIGQPGAESQLGCVWKLEPNDRQQAEKVLDKL